MRTLLSAAAVALARQAGRLAKHPTKEAVMMNGYTNSAAGRWITWKVLRAWRLLDHHRTICIRAGASSICGVILLAIVMLPHLRAATDAAAPEPPPANDKPANVSGVVRSADGQPIDGALVSIYSAGVRVGTSPFCPTC